MFEKLIKCLVLVFLLTQGYEAIQAKVGILSGPEDDVRQYSAKFWALGRNRSGVSLEPLIERLDWWGPLQITRAVCRLSERGATSLLALDPSSSSHVLESFSDFLGLPLLSGRRPSKGSAPSPFHVSLLPDTSGAVADVLRNYGWTSFEFLYDSQDDADQLQEVLARLELEPRVDGFWRASSAEEAFRVVNLTRTSSAPIRLLMATSESLADELVAKLAGLSVNIHIVLLRPVGILEQLSSHHGSILLTKFSLVESGDPTLSVLENRWKTIMPQGRANTHSSDLVILSHDASNILYAAYSKLERNHPFHFRNDSGLRRECNSNSPYRIQSSYDLAFYMKQVSLGNAVTGSITFDEEGARTDYLLHVTETTPTSQRKIGTWTPKQGLQLIQDRNVRLPDNPTSSALQEKPTFNVTSIKNEPFLYMLDDGRYQGYVVDLLDELSAELDWKFNLHLVKDGRYGMNLGSNQWNGMVGEVVRNEADFAVASLTKTPIRETVVDYSKSFMTTGLGILIKKPEMDNSQASRLGAFSFLTVWSYQTWLLLLLMIGVFSMVSYGLARFNGAPERIRALTTKESDRLSLCSSLWFISGSMLLRDTGIFPRSLSHRLSSVLWWSFSLFILMAYISSLAEHLIRSRTAITTTHARIAAHDLLKKFLETGSPVVGTLAGGSTEAFFLNSKIGTFHDFGRYISVHREVMTSTYKEGIERVRQSGGKYAFVLESMSGEYHANHEPCDTLMTSGFLDPRNFAIITRKGSPHRVDIDDALLKLMENGVLRQLYEKWWFNSSSICEDPNLDILPHVYSNSLTLHEVSGLFYIFIIFILLAVIAAAIESKRKKISLET